MPGKILIVDDDWELRSELRDFLEGYEVVEASSGQEALKVLKRAHEIGLAILDVKMPGLSGIDVLTQIKKSDPEMGIIILTGHSSKDVAIEALKAHADDFIEKPVDIEKFRDAVERLLEKGAAGSEGPLVDLKGKIEKVKRFVERNRFKKTTLEEAARAVCLSPKYLSRAFMEQERTGFTEYKLTVKIDAAKGLLKKGGCNVNEVSDKLGYENVESFIRQFKKICKCTPSAFRKKTKPRAKKKKSK